MTPTMPFKNAIVFMQIFKKCRSFHATATDSGLTIVFEFAFSLASSFLKSMYNFRASIKLVFTSSMVSPCVLIPLISAI